MSQARAVMGQGQGRLPRSQTLVMEMWAWVRRAGIPWVGAGSVSNAPVMQDQGQKPLCWCRDNLGDCYSQCRDQELPDQSRSSGL